MERTHAYVQQFDLTKVCYAMICSNFTNAVRAWIVRENAQIQLLARPCVFDLASVLGPTFSSCRYLEVVPDSVAIEQTRKSCRSGLVRFEKCDVGKLIHPGAAYAS